MDDTYQEITGMVNEDQKTDPSEGSVARTIANKMAWMSSSWFVWAAVGSILATVLYAFTFGLTRKKKAWSFLEEWVPTMLLLGVYHKVTRAFRHAW